MRTVLYFSCQYNTTSSMSDAVTGSWLVAHTSRIYTRTKKRRDFTSTDQQELNHDLTISEKVVKKTLTQNPKNLHFLRMCRNEEQKRSTQRQQQRAQDGWRPQQPGQQQQRGPPAVSARQRRCRRSRSSVEAVVQGRDTATAIPATSSSLRPAGSRIPRAR